jgi:hypothetical protein
LGRIKKGIKCSVKNCNEDAIRSCNTIKAKKAGLDVIDRRTYLCKEHYKDYKKGNKKAVQIEKWRYGIN